MLIDNILIIINKFIDNHCLYSDGNRNTTPSIHATIPTDNYVDITKPNNNNDKYFIYLLIKLIINSLIKLDQNRL